MIRSPARADRAAFVLLRPSTARGHCAAPSSRLAQRRRSDPPTAVTHCHPTPSPPAPSPYYRVSAAEARSGSSVLVARAAASSCLSCVGARRPPPPHITTAAGSEGLVVLHFGHNLQAVGIDPRTLASVGDGLLVSQAPAQAGPCAQNVANLYPCWHLSAGSRGSTASRSPRVADGRWGRSPAPFGAGGGAKTWEKRPQLAC